MKEIPCQNVSMANRGAIHKFTSISMLPVANVNCSVIPRIPRSAQIPLQFTLPHTYKQTVYTMGPSSARSPTVNMDDVKYVITLKHGINYPAHHRGQ